MTIFQAVKHSAAAQKVGVSLRPTTLIIFGNPKVGSQLMKCEQRVAIDLPQKFLIWQDEKDIVWVSMNDMEYLKKRHQIEGCDEIMSKVDGALNKILLVATRANSSD